MSITAETGTLSGDRETVTFRGTVRAIRDRLPEGTPAGNEPNGPITLSAETLRVVPKKGRAETDGPVTVEEPRGIIHANRNDGRQRGAYDQAQVRRPRHPRAGNCSPVNAFHYLHFFAAPAALIALACALLPTPARAEKADREKPINYSADTGDVNYLTKVGSLAGSVIITQGTLTVRADRMVFRQNPDNSMMVTAYGNPVSFRQKRDGFDEYYEGFAQRVDRRREEFVELFDRALLRRGQDEIRSNYISYSSATEIFKAEGRPGSAAAADSAGRIAQHLVVGCQRRGGGWAKPQSDCVQRRHDEAPVRHRRCGQRLHVGPTPRDRGVRPQCWRRTT